MRKLKSAVEDAEVGGGDGHEDDRHGGGLNEGFAVWPLDFFELRPARGEETDDAASLTLSGGLLLSAGDLLALAALALLAAPLLGLLGLLRLHAALGAARLRRVWRLELGFRRAGGNAGLDRLDLGNIAGHAELGVPLGVGLSVPLNSGPLLFPKFAFAPLGLALCSGFRHRAYRVSLCAVWRPHQRQNFRSSTRSGEFRRDLLV